MRMVCPSDPHSAINGRADGANITGANDSTYTLTATEIGAEEISVAVRYFDLFAMGEQVIGALRGPVISAGNPPTTFRLSQGGRGAEPQRGPSEPVILDNANGEDFTVTSILNGGTTDHRVTDVREGSIILEVNPAIRVGSRIEVSYDAVLGSIIGTDTGSLLASFGDLSVNNAVLAPPTMAEDLDRVGRKTLTTHLASAQSDLLMSTVQNHLQVLDGGNRVSGLVPPQAAGGRQMDRHMAFLQTSARLAAAI